MTYNSPRKIKFTIARHVKNICNWDKTEKQKRKLKILDVNGILKNIIKNLPTNKSNDLSP